MKRTLMQIYTKNRVEALEFYQKAFDAKPGFCDKAPDGTIIHAELDVYGQIFAVGELSTEQITGNTMQFCLQFDEGEEAKVERAYETLKDGGEVLYPLGSCFFSSYMTDIIDKHGVRWCIFI